MTNTLLVAVAWTTGAAVMMLELMAVRLMAPWFGQSQIVWTNVIGTVLAALALGQWLGGRWAERRRGPRVSTLLFFGGGFSLALPSLAAWSSQRLLPDDLSLIEAYPFVSLGSLVVALLAMGTPMVALGAVTPWLVRLSRDATTVPGQVTGRLLGAGTLGSLAGTFGATHVLLGWLGSAATVRVGGALLIAAGISILMVDRRGLASGLAGLLLPQLLLFLAAAPARNHERTLAEVETPYQWARVVEQADGTRLLRLNEGLDSFHSVYKPGSLWTGTYFDAFLYPVLTSPRADDGKRDVFIVGLAAGTMARQVLSVDPTARVFGVEIDADIVALGRRWFALPDTVRTASGMDGRVALTCAEGSYGAILIDAYAQQIYLPAHLCTREFFEIARRRLRPGGVAALNIGGRSIEEPLAEAVAETFGAVFPGAVAARVPGTRNLIVLGWNGPTPDHAWINQELAVAGASEQLAWLADGEGFMTIDEQVQGRILEDGHAPVERLADEAWSGRRSIHASPAVGIESAAGALELAKTCISQTRWSAAEDAVDAMEAFGQNSHAELLRGNLAWERGDFGSARRHYERSLEAGEANIESAAVQNLEAIAPLEQRQVVLARRLLAIREGLGWFGALAVAVVLACAWTTRGQVPSTRPRAE